MLAGWTDPSLSADTVTPAPAPAGAATTYQQNQLHDGNNAGEHLTFPLHEAWRRDFQDVDYGDVWVSYPVVVNGRVFVTVTGNALYSYYGVRLYALDGATGDILWGPVQLGDPYTFPDAGASADGTNLYTVNFDGLVEARDQVTGALQWSAHMPFEYFFNSPPTVTNGTLYFGGTGDAGFVYAVDTATGVVKWAELVENGDYSSPAVTTDGVYVSYACEQSYKFAPATGALLWWHQTDCEGGGGRTPVVHGQAVYVRDSSVMPPVILSTGNGAPQGSFQSDTTPGFDGALAFYVQGGTLSAVNLLAQRLVWSSSRQIVTAPIVAGGAVIAGASTGMLYGYDETTGAQIWSADAGRPILHPVEDDYVVLAGLTESGGALYVPATNVLIAYKSSCPCPITDQCHAGTCETSSGICTIVVKPEGSGCDDGDRCTQTDSCQSGTCLGSNSLTCVASDQCHIAGTCDPETGRCLNPTAAAGTPCDDHVKCTAADVCVTGSCVGSAINCSDGDRCTIDACPPAVGCVASTANLDTNDFSAERVDGRDLAVLAAAWNSCPGDASYNASAKLDLSTACIDGADFHAFMTAFGYHCGA